VSTVNDALVQRTRLVFSRRLTGIAVGAVFVRFLFILTERPLRAITDEYWFVIEARRLFTRPFTDPFFGYPRPFTVHLARSCSLPSPGCCRTPRITCASSKPSVGGLTVVVIGLVGRRLVSERVGLLAAALAALCPDLLMANGLVTSDTWAALGLALLLSLTFRLRDRWRTVEAVLFGALSALTILAWSETALAAPVCSSAWPSVPFADTRRVRAPVRGLAGAALLVGLLLTPGWPLTRRALTGEW
jgi:hypothetical protein